MASRTNQLLLGLSLLSTLLILTCVFHHGHAPGFECATLDEAPLKQLTSSDRKTVFEDPGIIIVYHGTGCAQSDKSGTEDIIKIEETLDTPGYANAAVFLNGWHLRYLHNEHNVAGLATVIRNIESEREHLKWQAVGVLSDQNFDDGYKWCYYYTVIAWNPSSLNLIIDQNDGACTYQKPEDILDANFFFTDNYGTTTSLSAFSTFLENPNFASSKNVAILPRGFGVIWGNIYDPEFHIPTDHHVLQLAYNLDHSEVFARKGKKYKKTFTNLTPVNETTVGSGYVSWDTYSIFKDNDERRQYHFGEMVSGLGGSDVNVIQPPFSILPVEDSFDISDLWTTCIPPAISQADFQINSIPYKYVIPMLTGWNLEYDCEEDTEIQETGIWIDEMQYDPNSPGTLRYKLSSIPPAAHTAHKVTLLAIKPAAPVGTSRKAPDLIPFSPNGTDPTAFCRIEQELKFLRVTVKNQGNDNSGLSKATVTFGTEAVTHDTPPIPAGGSVDVLFEVPASCFHPDCSFKISVDSSNQLNELNETNNSVNGGCIG